MIVKKLRRTQILPLTLQAAWSFFSSPKNLEKMTEPDINFNILHDVNPRMYAGQIIMYSIKLFHFYKTIWVTEITHVEEGVYFIDEQRVGPFALWHHQHHFRETNEGVEMTDEVYYAIGLGVIGRLAGWLFVDKRVNAIFDYRYAALKELFEDEKKRID